ncbi:MAG: cellulase family glycosylhydrolase [Candidatus Aenigmatarchaeota archaeon]
MKRLLILTLFYILILPSLVSATIFDNCDSLTPSNGAWDFVDDGGQKRGTNISVDYNLKVEGNASIHVKITNNTYWNYFYKRQQPGKWNFTSEPVIKFRIYPVDRVFPTYFGLVTGEPDGWGWNGHSYGQLNLTPNTWNLIEIDLRKDEYGNPLTKEALSMGVQLTISSKVIYNSYEFYIDYIEIMPGGYLPQGNLVFNVTSNGLPVENALIYLQNIKVKTNSSGLAQFPEVYTGNYSVRIFKLEYLPQEINVEVVENQTKFYSINLEKIDTQRPKVSKLHVEGKYLKDEEGNIIFLRGVNQPGFTDSPTGFWRCEGCGIWSGLCPWNASAVMDNLKVMKAWGTNAIRGHQTIRYWLDNEIIHYESKCNVTQPYRENVKDVIEMAAEMGMYYIFDAYNLKGYGEEGSTQDRMPFPPYTNNTDVIPNEDAFVEYWRSVASELKNYPNVIFEIYNEPVGIPEKTTQEAMTDWHRVWQKVINAIRSTGATQPIIIQWGYGIWVNLDYYTSPHGDLQWVENYTFNDPLNNLIYSTHIYRDGGFCHRSSSVPSSERNRWQYDEIKLCLNYTLVDYVVNKLNKPLFIGEIGANMWYSGVDLERELAYLNNTLSIMNDWGIGYTVWVWTVPAHMRHGILENGIWIPPPNDAGMVLIKKIAEGGIYAINFSGIIKDKEGNPLKANITLKNERISYNLTEVNGNYALIVRPSIYDAYFNISNSYLILKSLNLTSSIYNNLVFIHFYPKKTSLTFNLVKNQTVWFYSEKDPIRILVNGQTIPRYNSLPELGANYGWFYDNNKKIIYMNLRAS